MPKDSKKFVEKAQGAVTQEFDDEEAKKILTATRILDDSDEEVEQEDARNKATWANLVAANKRGDAEESKTSDVIKDIYFRKDRKQEREKIKMEPFNMRQEREEGYFDEFSVYHANKKDDSDDEFQRMLNDDQHDLETHKDKNIYEKHIERYRKEHEAFESKEETQEDVLKIYEEIFPILANGETISQAIARVGKTKRKRQDQDGPPRKKKKKKKNRRAWEIESDDDQQKEDELSPEEIAKNKEQFDILSDRSSRLTTIGDYGIYDVGKAELYRRMAMLKAQKRALEKQLEARKKAEAAAEAAKKQEDVEESSSEESESEDEDIMNAARAKQPAGCAPKPPTEDADGNPLYEYRFRAGDQKVHGPFPLPKLKGWNEKGFFHKRTIFFRRIGEVEWHDSTVVDLASV